MEYRLRQFQVFALVVAAISLLVLAFPVIATLVQTDGSTTEMRVHPQSIDLGIVSQGERVPFEFSLCNTTSYDIHAVSLHPSCGCTLLDQLSNPTLAANSSLLVKGVFNSNQTRGKQAKHILVSWSSEQPRRQTIVTINVDVTPTITVTPSTLEFRIDPLKEESVKTKRIGLRSAADIPFKIDDLRWTHPALNVTMPTGVPNDRLGSLMVLDIAFDSRHPSAHALTGISYIQLRTSSPLEPRLRIPVKIVAAAEGGK